MTIGGPCPTWNPTPWRGACANYMCTQYGCQGHCGWRPLHYYWQPISQPGCICPPGSEKTCQALVCYRRGTQASASGMETSQGGNEVPSRSDDSPTGEAGDAQ